MQALILAPSDGSEVMNNANTLAKVIQEAFERENFNVDMLEGGEVSRKNLPDKHYDAIVYCGHGTDRSLMPNGRPLFDDTNADYFENSVVIAIACGSAKWLGLTATSKGAKAYIGFNDLVYIPMATDKHNYLGDFIRAFMVIPLSILEGYSVHQATQEFMEMCMEYAIEYETKSYDSQSGVMYAWILHNGNAVHYEGSPSVSLGDESLVIRAV